MPVDKIFFSFLQATCKHIFINFLVVCIFCLYLYLLNEYLKLNVHIIHLPIEGLLPPTGIEPIRNSASKVAELHLTFIVGDFNIQIIGCTYKKGIA